MVGSLAPVVKSTVVTVWQPLLRVTPWGATLPPFYLPFFLLVGSTKKWLSSEQIYMSVTRWDFVSPLSRASSEKTKYIKKKPRFFSDMLWRETAWWCRKQKSHGGGRVETPLCIHFSFLQQQRSMGATGQSNRCILLFFIFCCIRLDTLLSVGKDDDPEQKQNASSRKRSRHARVHEQ